MKDYADMSDFEISRSVGDVLGVEWAKMGESYHELCYWPELDGELRIFDPCNNPADAWPIIAEYGIGIIPYKNGLAEAWNVSRGLIEGTTKDKNPLRCAMIVFLVMKEGEND